MTTHCYHSLPATLRGNALEAHGGWPRTWTATDDTEALRVADALHDVLHAGGVWHLFELSVDGCVVTLTRDEGVAV